MYRPSRKLWLYLLLLPWLIMALGSSVLHTHVQPTGAQAAIQHTARNVSHDCPACTWLVTSNACSPSVVTLDSALDVTASALPSRTPAPLSALALNFSRAPPLA